MTKPMIDFDPKGSDSGAVDFWLVMANHLVNHRFTTLGVKSLGDGVYFYQEDGGSALSLLFRKDDYIGVQTSQWSFIHEREARKWSSYMTGDRVAFDRDTLFFKMMWNDTYEEKRKFMQLS